MCRKLLAAALSCQLLQLSAAGGCSGSPEACAASADDASGALGLLQFSSGRASTQRNSGASTAGVNASGGTEQSTVLRGLSRFSAATAREWDCKTYPNSCEAPYNCESQPLTPDETDYMLDVHVAQDDGHPNLRTWCLDASFDANNVKLCLNQHDLKANAQALYEVQIAKGVGQTDGSYCFLEGHCTNKNVTYDTTLEDSEAICDAKYGHESWTKLRFADKPEEHVAVLFTGYPSRKYSSYYGKLACAMGNFHCDVIYCQETYCQMEEYRKKYGHFLAEYGYTS